MRSLRLVAKFSFFENELESDVYFEGDAMELKLQKAIASLPEKQRLIFNMRYFEEIKYEKMSEILETSVGGLKASYHHAVKKIKNRINEWDWQKTLV